MPSLYSTYRPKTFTDVIGQPHITSLILAELKRSLTGHAYIFVGPRGTGKTTTARILAKALNCENLQEGNPCNECASCNAFEANTFVDLIEIDAASNRGIDEIRDLKQKIEYNPAMGKKKVYIIDEVHMLTKEAFNALLKTLEEPPSYATFILATTEPHKIPATIMSRCEKFEFRLGGSNDITEVLDGIIAKEGVSVSPEALSLLITHSGGSYRDAISLLDTIIAVTGDKDLTEEEVRTALGLPESAVIVGYIDAVMRQSLPDALEVLDEIFKRGTNISQFTKTLVLTIRDLLIGIVPHDVPESFGKYSKSSLTKMIKHLLDAYSSQKYAFDHRLPLQLATAQLINNNEQPLIKNSDKVEKVAKKEAPVEKDKDKEEDKSESINIEKKVKAERPVEEKKIQVANVKEVGKSVEFSTIEEKWDLFKKEVQTLHKQLYTFVMTATPSGAQFDVQVGVTKVEIKVPFEFHKKQLENPKHQEILLQAARNIYGEPMQLICLISKEELVFTERKTSAPSATVPAVQAVKVEAASPDPESVEAAFDAVLGADVDSLT